MSKTNDTRRKTAAPLDTPTDLSSDAVSKISAKLNEILATTFALYLKTKNFHWHVSGPHFRDYHLLLDQHGDQIFAITDDIAERVRKIGGTTIRSIGQISKLQGIDDNNENFVPPVEMLRELMNDNKMVAASMREWGWTNPILVSADDDLIAGRARLLAADKLGMKEVSVIVLCRLSPGAIRSQEPATCGSLKIALNLRLSGA